jgi:hypothetical protein
MIFLVIFLITTLNITNKKEREMSAYRDYVEENIDHLIDNQMEQEKEKIKKDYNEGELLSTCCGWSPASEPVGDNGNKEDDIIALCSKCKDWSGFEYETDEEL